MTTSFEAVFTRGPDATAFYDRLTADPAAFYTANVTRNRKGGRIVRWDLDEDARDTALKALAARYPDSDYVPAATEDPAEYLAGMCETVGYYGSTFGEPPFGTGRRTATLNGRPCPASM